MPANFRKIMEEVPRPLELAARDSEGEVPIGRQKIGSKEFARRAEGLMPLIASGDVPLDDQSAKLVAAYLREHHNAQQRQPRD